jgi:hypothetical protein
MWSDKTVLSKMDQNYIGQQMLIRNVHVKFKENSSSLSKNVSYIETTTVKLKFHKVEKLFQPYFSISMELMQIGSMRCLMKS